MCGLCGVLGVGVDGLLSELDEYAVEQALQLKEGAEEEVTVTASGSPTT